MDNSQDATSKCFSGVLRRLLCTGSLPTYPTDHIPESDPINFNFPHQKDPKTEAKPQPQAQAQATPGIVARLMGLDSLPDINLVPKHTTLESILRSRSVNFTDYMPDFDPTQAAEHRRVRTSVSFREAPTFINQQAPDFFVLCFEKALSKANEKRVTEKNLEKGIEEMKPNKAERSKNRDNIRDRVVSVKKRSDDRDNKNKNKVCKGVSGETSSEVSNVLPHKKDGYRKPSSTLMAKSPAKTIKPEEGLIESSFTKKKKNQNVAQKVKPVCNSVNSSPFSVSEPPISGLKSSSKITNCDYPSSKVFHTLKTVEDQELRMSSQQADMPVQSEETECYSNLLVQICRLAEENMEDSNWVNTQGVLNFEDFEEICIGFEHHIFDLLLNQVADEIVGLHKLKNLTL